MATNKLPSPEKTKTLPSPHDSPKIAQLKQMTKSELHD